MDASQIPTRGAIVTPSDSALVNAVGIVYSGGACTIKTTGGDTIALPTDFAGMVLPFQIAQVMSTGTTATSVLVFK